MRTSAALAGLILLAACNRHGAADVTLDADAATRNATSAKTASDLAAADAASQGPAPVIATPAPGAAVTPKPSAPVDEESPADESPSNDLATSDNSTE